MSMSSATIFGLMCPISSTRSACCSLTMKSSIALSSKKSTVEFLIILQRCMYDQSDSFCFYVQALTSYVDVGHL
jgi:hypothetical protein